MSKKQTKNSKGTQSYIVGALLLLFIAFGAWFLLTRNGGESTTGEDDFTPVESVSHIHGLAIDLEDSSKLYIATYHGLLLLKNDQELFHIGKSKDDFMGFSPYPTDFNIFFASGHPAGGGNLGVIKSEDQGRTWKKIAAGARGPVDFHAMAISHVNPQILYGWYANVLQRSMDGGVNWEIVQDANLPAVITLATDTIQEDVMYAGTVGGFYVSRDKGVSWNPIGSALSRDAVIAVSLHPQQPQGMLVFSQNSGLMRSADGGISWESVDADFGGDLVLHLARSRSNPTLLYAATKGNAIYKSSDSGLSWQRVR